LQSRPYELDTMSYSSTTTSQLATMVNLDTRRQK